MIIIAPLFAWGECFNDLGKIFEQGKEYFLREQYLLASQQFSLFSLLSCQVQHQDQGRLRWAQALLELGETEEGFLLLNQIDKASPYFEKSRIIQAWYQPTLIPSLPPSAQKRFQDWETQVNSLPLKKKPWLAGTLSAVLPGAGQVYNGNYQSGLFSFVLNALFLSATIELTQHNLKATAAASGTIFSVVYVGNIASAIQSSKKINTLSHDPSRSTLKFNLFPELTF